VRRRYRWGRIFLVSAIFLGMACAFVWVSLWLRPPQDTSLLLAGASYEDNLAVPPNLYGWNGLKDIAAVGRKGPSGANSGTIRLLAEPREFRLDDEWKKSLRDFPGKTLIVCLSLHGGADAKGAYFLTANAYLPRDPLSPERDKIRVEELFDALKTVPVEKNVLLVLDATQIVADWSLGMLNNDFARSFEKWNERIATMPNLLVMCASGPDQRSWVAEEWKRTIFQHYLLEGLRGGADAAPADGRIDGAELFQYVHRQVKGWAAANRDATQTPVLFPSGQSGLERARKVQITAAKNYRPADPALLKPFVPPKDLADAWQRYERLRAETPAPAVYTPERWRLYQERLLRYEQLVQAGYSAAALNQASHLRDLELEMMRARGLELGSLGNSLGMHSVAGYFLPGRESALRWVNKLWDAAGPDRAAAWAAAQGEIAADKSASPLLAVTRLREVLIERAIEAPRENLSHAAELLRLTYDGVHPLPAEAHFLIMLERDLPSWNGESRPTAPLWQRPDVLKRALQVRLLAEKAAVGGRTLSTIFEKLLPGSRAPYSAQLLPWYREEVERGDLSRRKGEDLLFATDAASLERAAEYLAEAEKSYLLAQETALRARQAYAVRDEIVPLLPFYVRWLGQRRPRDAMTDPLGDMQLSLTNLCLETHKLEAMLTRPVAGRATPTALELQALSAQADLALKLLRELESASRAFRTNLEEANLPSVWRDIDAALAMPFEQLGAETDPAKGNRGLRMQLIESKSRIAQRFLVNYAHGSRETISEPDRAHDNPKERARALGTLALLLIGQETFDKLGKDLESYDDVATRLKVFALEEKWWDSLQIAAQQIGQRGPRRTQNIQAALDLCRKAGPYDALPELSDADHLARYAGAAGILALTRSAPTAYRLALTEDLLYNQVRRTWLDHWAAWLTAREPYYRVAGFLYLDDAQALLEPSLLGPDTRLPKLRADLQKDNALKISLASAPGWKSAPTAKAPAALHWTSEQEFALRYRFEAAGLTNGFATLWADVGLGLTVKDGPVPPQRVLRGLDGDADVLLDFRLAHDNPAPPRVRETGFTVRGLWRGHVFDGQTPILIYPEAHTVVSEHPLPLTSSVAVRAPKELHDQFGAASGAVAIVLDISGSMGPIPGGPADQRTKYMDAVAALRKVLARLPRGTTVSLWTFGQAVGDTEASPEKTITRLLPPTEWDPDNVPQLNALITSLEGLRPWNESPIVRAMLQASQDLRDATGFKTMLVLTDGLDNRFATDKEINPGKADIAAALRQFFPDIEVNLIGFRLEDGEEDKARAQFAEVEKLPIPGNIYMTKDAGKLVSILDSALKQQLRYWVDYEDGRPLPGYGATGLDISFRKAGDQWVPGGLAPGAYRVRTQTNQRISRAIGLNRGDLLLLELNRLTIPGVVGEPLGIYRPLYAMTDFPWKPNRARGNWLLAALQNQRKDNGVEMLFSLERKDNPLTPTITQSVPYKTWFEVAPPRDVVDTLPANRWNYQPGYPAPAFSYRVADWPTRPGTGAALKPTVRAWWSADRDPPAAAALDKGHDFTDPRDIRDVALLANDQEIVIESVRVENHPVAVRPPGDSRQLRPCLVVRVKTSANNPVYVRLQGITPAGAEHRFYTQAGKYTAIFWPVTRDEMILSLRRIEIVSLAAFKRDAQARNAFIELDSLAEPQATDERPIPPVNLMGAWPTDVRAPAGPLRALPTSLPK